jgi:hypothetical protein
MQFCGIDVVTPEAFPSDFMGLDLLTQARLIWLEILVILFSRADGNTCDLVDIQKVFTWIRKSSDPGILLSILALAMEQRVKREPVWALDMVSA